MKTTRRHLPWVSFTFLLDPVKKHLSPSIDGVFRGQDARRPRLTETLPTSTQVRARTPGSRAAPNRRGSRPGPRNQQGVHPSPKPSDAQGQQHPASWKCPRSRSGKKGRGGSGGRPGRAGEAAGRARRQRRKRGSDARGRSPVGPALQPRPRARGRVAAEAPRTPGRRGLALARPGTHRPRFSSWRGTPWSDGTGGSARLGPARPQRTEGRTRPWRAGGEAATGARVGRGPAQDPRRRRPRSLREPGARSSGDRQLRHFLEKSLLGGACAPCARLRSAAPEAGVAARARPGSRCGDVPRAGSSGAGYVLTVTDPSRV